MKNDLRVSMPEEIMLRMAQADTPDAARQEGIKIAQEMLEAVRPYVQGVQVSAPFGRYTVAAEVIASVLPQGSTPNGVNAMPSFEESLKKLETIVDQLEKGDLAWKSRSSSSKKASASPRPASRNWTPPKARCRCWSSSATAPSSRSPSSPKNSGNLNLRSLACQRWTTIGPGAQVSILRPGKSQPSIDSAHPRPFQQPIHPSHFGLCAVPS